MPDLESIILRQILKCATTPLTPEQILNEIREMGYPRVKAREVEKALEAANNKSRGASFTVRLPVPQ